MSNSLIELTCSAEWISHVAHSRQEAEAYAREANRWWAANKQQFPCPFEEYIPASAFAVDFEATQSARGCWAVYVDCGWALSEHKSVQEALDAADQLYDAHGVSESLLEILVFGHAYDPENDSGARPLALMNVELAIFKGSHEGLTSYVLGGVKGALTTKEEFLPASELF